MATSEGPAPAVPVESPGAPTALEGRIDADTLEAGEDSDSAYGGSSAASETTSLASSIIRGHIENGRRYSSLREDYWGASDETQFKTMDLAHYAYLILLSDHDNMLFRAPVQNPKQVLDIWYEIYRKLNCDGNSHSHSHSHTDIFRTGPGTWAVDVADHFPDATVHAVDIYPPPTDWV